MNNKLVKLLVLLLLVCMLGSTVAGAQEDEMPVIEEPIVWYLRTAVQEDLPLINEAVNEHLAELGFNATVEIIILDRSEFNDRISLINSAGELYDMTLTTYSWVNVYPVNVANEYLIPLDAYYNPDTGEEENLLLEYAPQTWASMPEGAWEAARIAGNIYAVPNQQIWVKPFGVSIRTDVLDALDLMDEYIAVQSYADLTPIMQQIKDTIDDGSLADLIENGENVQAVFATVDMTSPGHYGYDGIGGGYAIDVNDPEMNLVYWYETDAFRAAVELRREWQEKGFTTADPLDTEAQLNGYTAGQWVMDVGRLVKPGGALEQGARFGYEWTEVAIAPAFLATGGPTATMTGVSSTIEDDPERVHRVMQFIELMNTDVELYNLVSFGIEGLHWNWVDQEQLLIELVPDSGYNPGIAWQLGNQFNAYYIDSNQVGAWPQTMELNMNATPSPALGFVFDPTPVATEIASIDAILPEYIEPLNQGQIPIEEIDAHLAAMMEALNAAGLETVKEELQSQLDAWRGSE